MVEISRGTSLLLTARERVLSLSEQRVRLQIIFALDSTRQLTGHTFLRCSSLYCPD